MQETSLDLWATAPGENDASLNPVTQRYSLTGDANIVRARFVLRYQVADPFDYVLRARDRDGLRDVVVYECASQVLATMNVDDALTTQKAALGQEVLRRAQAEMARLKLGLRLLALDVREIDPPRSVLPAFQSVVTARLQAKTLLEQANAYAATTLPAAQQDAYRTTQEAEAYAGQAVAQAQGEAAAFLDQSREYQANPQLVRARLINDMREAVLPQARVLSVMPAGAGPSTLLLAPGGSP
ncbi:MAG: SPFH domain-containing protein [Verrucomicrobiota bacterium]